MKKCAHIALILLAVIMLGACDGYNKLVKSTDYATQYSEAMRYYNEGRYSMDSIYKYADLYKDICRRYLKCARKDKD